MKPAPKQSSFTPEFIRLPSPRTRCKHTGLSRTSLLELCAPSQINGFKPPVRSHVIKKPGAVRGIRLLDYASLLKHIRGANAGV